ncbi:disintegrin [Thecamonas trahens ATCC 50062]|uniref:Disintegrin n=1 Tax=Thecamonas trahens ATCC 50062 TaxID=461836 RepID=A0A0L0DJS2_THETB|nr:disintegrin [Thecamonas trahens ATCC 50062]KNC52361.1 disintegrin [Thecamonas trahens ATCC 50062]|eukprot:XP_013755410.1 disintegrin [Thecamonas trahens ATCC 50062]
MSVDDAIVLYDTVTGQLGVDKRNTVVSYPRYLGSSGSMDYGLASYGGKFDSWGAALTATAIRRSQFGVGFASRSVSGGSKTFLFRADVFVHTSITVTVTDVSPTMVDAGTVVTIIGTGFEPRPTGDMVVLAGTTAYTATPASPTPALVTVVSSSEIHFVVPSQPVPTVWRYSISVGLSDSSSPGTISPVPDTTSESFSIVYKGCGNNVVEAGEQCESGLCCDVGTCMLRAASTVCRVAADLCDAAEQCDGITPACPPDVTLAAGTECGSASQPCAKKSTCDGVAKICPPSGFQPATFVCRPASDSCDQPEFCTGVSDTCPSDAVKASGELCRPQSSCAYNATCDGVAKSCPASVSFPDGTLCRGVPASGPHCDVPETCVSGSCPIDGFLPKDTLCSAASGPCEQDSVCSGAGPACPANLPQSAGIECRASGGPCDPAEACDGVSANCPEDAKLAAGTVCSSSSFPCVANSVCDGASSGCPANQLLGTDVVCRASSQPCDAPETCSGTAPTCPIDELHPAGFECRAAGALPCEPSLVCSGESSACTNTSTPIPDSCLSSTVQKPRTDKSKAAVAAASTMGALAFLGLLVVAVLAYVMWRRRAARHITMPDFAPFRYYNFATSNMSALTRARACAALLLGVVFEGDGEVERGEDRFALARSLVEVSDFADRDRLLRAMLYLYMAPGFAEAVVIDALSVEVAAAQDTGSLLRANSAASKLWQAYTRAVGLEFVWASVGELVAIFVRDNEGDARATDAVVEVESLDVRQHGDGDLDDALEIGVVKYAAMALAQKMLSASLAAVEAMPNGMVQILQALYGLVRAKFGDDPATKSVLAFVFLRALCPAVSMPSAMGMTPLVQPTTRKSLVVVAKILQNVANKVEFGGKEPHMSQFNDFVLSNLGNVDAYVGAVLARRIDTGSAVIAPPPPDKALQVAAGVVHTLTDTYAQSKPALMAQLDHIPPIAGHGLADVEAAAEPTAAEPATAEPATPEPAGAEPAATEPAKAAASSHPTPPTEPTAASFAEQLAQCLAFLPEPVRLKDLLTSGTEAGVNKANTDNWPSSFGSITYGGPTDTWGLASLTPDDLASPNFGWALAVSGTDSGAVLKIRHGGSTGPTMTVYYSMNAVVSGHVPAAVTSGEQFRVIGSGLQTSPDAASQEIRCRFGGGASEAAAVSVAADGSSVVCTAPDPALVGASAGSMWKSSVEVSMDGGTTWSGTIDLQYVGCGNGIVDIGENCDETSACCTSSCLFAPATAICRVKAGPCDAAELCPGDATDCPQDDFLPALSVCTSLAADDVCATPGVCNGSSITCPPPGLAAAGTVCRAAADTCDVAETCDGVSTKCPTDKFVASGTMCEAGSECSFPSVCTGSGPNCPPRVMRTSVCRASRGRCDVEESCDGVSPTCPSDSFEPDTKLCATAPSVCATDAFCTGIGPECPAFTLAPAGTVCRPANTSCDLAEECNGLSALCPIDVVLPFGTVCAAARGECENEARCSGVSAMCPARTLKPASTECRPAAGPCDVAEFCTAGAFSCPVDNLVVSGQVCKQDSPCDVPLVCSGMDPGCTEKDDSFEPAASCEARVVAAPPKSNSGAVAGASVVGVLVLLGCIAAGVAAAIVVRRRRAEAARLEMPDLEPFRFYGYATAEMEPTTASLVANAAALGPLFVADARGGEFALAHALFDSLSVGDLDHACKAMLYSYAGSQSGSGLGLVLSRIRVEVAAAADEGTLFRTNSAATKLMQAYARMVGLEYLWQVVGVHVVTLYYKLAGADEGKAMELDATRGSGTEDVAVSRYEVSALAQKVLSSIVRGRREMPPGMVAICQTLHASVGARFGPVGAARGVSGFLFLRFFCSSVAAPESVGFLPHPPEPAIRRQLTLLSKVLQNLANKVMFGGKEPYMIPLNEFLEANAPALDQYIDDLVAAPSPPQAGSVLATAPLPDKVTSAALGVTAGFVVAANSVAEGAFRDVLARHPPLDINISGGDGPPANAAPAAAALPPAPSLGHADSVDGIELSLLGNDRLAGKVDVDAVDGDSCDEATASGEAAAEAGASKTSETEAQLTSAFSLLNQLAVILAFVGTPAKRTAILRQPVQAKSKR